jgi:Beta-galactosidase
VGVYIGSMSSGKLNLYTAAAVLCAALLQSLCSITAAAQEQKPKPRPAWLHETPIVMVSNHDSMPIFRRRVGGNTTWQLEDYEKEHTEEAVRKLKELGVTMVITHFYKGFGLEAEREHQKKALVLAALVKKYGMRLGVYVGSTIAYETFLAEKPEAESWFVPDYLGKPVFYDNQTFRKRVYFMHPGYREYMRRVLTLAETEFHADLIHFDNTSMQAEPSIFQHPLAVQDFREFLKHKYTAAQLQERFGFSDLRYIEPPKYDKPLGAINDPLFEEWADFRCVQLTAYYAEMENLLRGLNPDVAVETNPHSGISGRNTVWEQGVDYPRLLAHLDAVWTEEGDPAGVTPDGILVSRIRTFKMANTLHNTLFVASGGESGNILEMAESLAFNRQCIGDLGSVLAGYDAPEDQRRYVQFFLRNFDQYRGIDNIADVAVLHSFASMAFNNDRPAVSTMLFEQALIESKIPFDVIFDDNLKNLSKYRVLALPDQECLDDAQMALIRKFVAGGGAVVATENTSLFTSWRERRRDFGLSDLFHVHAPVFRGNEARDQFPGAEPVRIESSGGRVVYIPEIKPAIKKPVGARMTSEYWKLPLNWEEVVHSVRWAGGGGFSLEVNAPRTVVTEPMKQAHTNKLLVHLLNYDVVRTPSLSNIDVRFRLPNGASVANVTLLSPDHAGVQALPHRVVDGAVAFTVPLLATYDLAVIQLR